MDGALIFAHGFLSMMLSTVVVGQYSVKINLSSNKLKKGDNMTITCDVINHLNTSVMMSWIRKHGQQETVIARDEKLSDEFQRGDRYRLRSKEEVTRNNHYKFTLAIQDLRASDSGEIGCLLPDNNIEIFKTVTVLSPVEVLRLNSTDLDNTHATTYMNDQTVYFREGEIHRFACSASGSYPEPRLTVFAGDEDITESFSRVSKLKEHGPRSTDGKIQFIEKLFYEVILTNDHLNISHDFNNKQIRCVVDLPGSDFPSKNIAVQVRLSDFCPKFECAHEIVTRRHQHNVDLSCRVISQPEVTKGSFHWKRSTQGNLSIETGKSDGIFTGILRPMSADGTVKTMVLRIAHMFPQHFRSYFFHAENRNCVSIKGVRIREDTSTDFHSGGSSLRATVTTTTTQVLVTAIIIVVVNTVFTAASRVMLT